MDGQSFFVGINQNGVTLNKVEIDCLLSGLNTDNDGVVDYDLFLCSLRGELSAARIACSSKHFARFDPNQTGRVAASDLRVAFKSQAHPKVVSGEITEDEAFLEFLTNFGDKNNDGQISMQEWADYYSAVSACINDDDHYNMLMSQAWE